MSNVSGAPVHIVWFKRDLRVSDHEPLARAALLGPVLPLYVLEPELWKQPDASGRHYDFLMECLSTLDRDLTKLGQPLLLEIGEMPHVLEALRKRFAIAGLWSHQETGNGWTYERDKAVGRWCRQHQIPWREYQGSGVIRALSGRSGWSARWQKFMAKPRFPRPKSLAQVEHFPKALVPSKSELGLLPDLCPGRQPGGRDQAISDLRSFLKERGRNYRFEMSSPRTADKACSRLSTHLAFGTLSMREVLHSTAHRQDEILKHPHFPDGSIWNKSLLSFTSRLHWHCHFIQKLESEPEIEFQNFHKAYDGLRPDGILPGSAEYKKFQAWATGQTGFPFVDACMRSLISTGWINFRMRAMLVAFATYHLWLPWREVGLHLAKLFTDYEPGIHWSQVQMQSGTTGINTIRIYNPVKQGHDQDPDGDFVRRWVPELLDYPDVATHEPWKLASPGSIYPLRIVDHEIAAREAREKIWNVRKSKDHRAEAEAVLEQHGSRKAGRGKSKKAPAKDPQLKFEV